MKAFGLTTANGKNAEHGIFNALKAPFLKEALSIFRQRAQCLRRHGSKAYELQRI